MNVDLYATEADVAGDILELAFKDVDEVLMEHVLEHISWRDTGRVLERVGSWLSPDGVLIVEVPDMGLIAEERSRNDDWVRYFYGSQEHEGEVHRAGFTPASLREAFVGAGLEVVSERWFRSENSHRSGMPCLRMVGRRFASRSTRHGSEKPDQRGDD